MLSKLSGGFERDGIIDKLKEIKEGARWLDELDGEQQKPSSLWFGQMSVRRRRGVRKLLYINRRVRRVPPRFFILFSQLLIIQPHNPQPTTLPQGKPCTFGQRQQSRSQLPSLFSHPWISSPRLQLHVPLLERSCLRNKMKASVPVSAALSGVPNSGTMIPS